MEAYKDSPLSVDELACVYSALILVDDGLSITEDKIKTILNAANVSIEPIWPSLFAKALQGVNVRELITGAGASAAAVAGAAPPAGAPAAGAAAAAEEAPKEEAKKEEPADEDSDEDFGLSLFD